MAECAILAGLPQAPSRYSPYRHYERAMKRQEYVLKRMVEEGFINLETGNPPWNFNSISASWPKPVWVSLA